MQKISDSTNTADAAGEFTEGSPAAGVPATLVKADWLNAIQRELCGLVLGAGISLNASDDSQVLKAVKALLSGMGSSTGGTVVSNADALTTTCIVRVGPTWTGSPNPGTDGTNQGSVFHRSAFDGDGYQVQMFQSMSEDQISWRRKTDGEWQPHVFAWHTGNLGQATTTERGIMPIATTAKVDAGVDAESAVTPLTLADRLAAVLVGATTSIAGLIKLATQAMVDAGADNNSAVTPLTLKKRLEDLWVSATTTVSGVLKLATQVMVDAGTDNNSAVTPLTLKNRLAAVIVGATESVAGVIRVATTDIMSGGIDNSAAVTVARLRFGFYFLAATNGCIAFPVWLGGFVIQWGTNGHTVSGTQTTSLPMAFPRGVFGALGGTVGAIAPQGTVAGMTYTQISTYSAAGYNVFWIALGY
ncbi:gp53-like domain-containing protein [Pseudomonas chlororaphis]|uniref:gp53-like domain-containing protein n=1 Tax=Pseudomonas chlororaphis TaxID=587753 RepID=UPI000F56573D|nr:hypothetical protein [Pseudomonas chlororaphis]AZC67357.1 Phage tail fiber protein [Pseudomonas chlororaphis subsp. piscium]